MPSVCTAEVPVTVSIIIPTVAQKCFTREFVSPVTVTPA